MITLTLSIIGGQSDTVSLRGIGPDRFEEAAKAVDAQDVLRLIEITCDQKPGWSKLLTPESFTEVWDKVQEVNGGFFGYYSGRQMLASLKDPQAMLRGLPKEVLVEMVKSKARKPGGSTTSPS